MKPSSPRVPTARARCPPRPPTATTSKEACQSAGLVGPDGKATYTPGSLRHFSASTALAHGVPIHEVSRWLGHRSVKSTIDIYGHLLPSAWGRCRTVLQNAMRPAPLIEAGSAEAPTGSGVSTQATGQGVAGDRSELHGAGIAAPSSPVITPAHPYRAGIVLGWDGNARAGFRTLCCPVRRVSRERLHPHAFFTASWPRAETNLHLPDVVDLLAEGGSGREAVPHNERRRD
ncbi:tyrosine-type recombinase/integrase [Streptomyces sp. VB1]|nr:tyrosine-type recombinase/integrase [Streptomyces sp. VB1]UZI28110.1 tyrosine-type recombinase/integrase [Streptomyces sp. VB1]